VKPEPIDVEKAQDVIFEPNPGPQTDFLSASEQEVLYGGAAGGGKSFAMLADPVRYFNNPLSSMLLVRRSTEELRELISVSKQLYPRAIPGIKFMERDKTWVAPSGATLWLSYLDRDDDVQRYQGQAFNWIGFDELTQWPSPYPWNYMRSRLRTTKNSGLGLYQRGTTNPGGSGHQWVKKTFVDPAPHNTSFDATDMETGEVIAWPKGHSKEGQPLFKRRFIPATLFDNPYLADMILEAEDGEKIRYGVLDSSLWHKRGDTGPSLAEQMIMQGCRWRPADRSRGSRVAGKNEIHRRLQVDEFTEEPRLVFFNTCTNTISQIPALPLDKNNPEDVDTHSEDHLYDAIRYGVMTRPRSSLFDFDPATQRSGFQASDPTFGY